MTMNGSEQEIGLVFIFFVVGLNAIIHPLAISKTKKKIRDIEKMPIRPSEKLRFLKNMDIYFDFPMYAGLGLNIFAFMLITLMNAESARFLAFVSTFIGIGVTVGMRFHLEQRTKEALIHADLQESKTEGVR